MNYYSYKTGMQFGMSDVGWGVKIHHWGSIIINGNAKVGEDLTIYPGVTIGQTAGDKNNVPVIGNNVFIYPNAMVCGKIKVGNNVTILANSVVTHDVPDNVIVGGIPAQIIARQIKKKKMKEFIIPKKICDHVVMTGVYYKNNHPGGISAVVQYWSKYIENLQYYPTFKEGSNISKLFVFFKSVLALKWRLLKDKNIKILHAHTAAGTDFRRTAIMVNIAKQSGLKVILHSHASSFKDYYRDSDEKMKKWIRTVLNKADILIVLSESWKQFFVGIGVPERKITILHNIAAYPKIKSIDKQEDKIRLLFLGEIGQRKGIFDLLRAIGNHKEELKDKIELRIGGNKMEDKLRTTISEYGIGDFVHFEGFVSGEKKIELLNWANIYVLPSYNEGLPISILEAMSYKMPIISTHVGGIPEVVDETNGILIEPGNSEQIYNAIYRYVLETELVQKQGVESYKKVQTYMPDYVMNHLKEIYENLL